MDIIEETFRAYMDELIAFYSRPLAYRSFKLKQFEISRTAFKLSWHWLICNFGRKPI